MNKDEEIQLLSAEMLLWHGLAKERGNKMDYIIDQLTEYSGDPAIGKLAVKILCELEKPDGKWNKGD